MARACAALATLCVFVSAVHFSASASMKKDLSRATANKSLALADTLQHDLRKNNDDYKDVAAAAARLRNPYLGGAAPPDLDERQGNALGPAPAAGNGSAPTATDASNGATKAVVTATTSAPAPARRSNNKLSRLHQLLDKEGLLQKFIRGLPVAGKKKIDWLRAGEGGERGSERGSERSGVGGGQRGSERGGERGSERGGERSGVGGGQRGGERGGVGSATQRPRAFDSTEYFRPPPDTIPEPELDMLAATGERIDTLKRRGRLCYRHILFPEGPKYDSRGKVYLKAHEFAINFASTRRPKMLLPRCCNCCKKSVLGCE